MPTELKKPVRRRTVDAAKYSQGKTRRYVVTLYPGDVIGIRLEKCRTEEIMPIGLAFTLAARLRIADERDKKKKSKLVRRGKL